MPHELPSPHRPPVPSQDDSAADQVEQVVDGGDSPIDQLRARIDDLERSHRECEHLVEELVVQATADFEERTWLRRLFEDVQHFDPSTAFAAIKFNLLAPLRHLAAARSVRLLPVGEGHRTPLPHLVVGDGSVDADACRRFVEDVLDVTGSHRLLFNRHARTASLHTALVPAGVDGAIAIGIEVDDGLRGWLLLFDKLVPPTNDEARRATSGIGLSETEFGTVEFSLAECAASSLAARLRLLEAVGR